MDNEAAPTGPDFAAGVPVSMFSDTNLLRGHVGNEPVLLARVNGECFAVSATCPHYGAPLVDGVILGYSLRCPWHHARFDVRSGAVTCPPARDGLARWRVQERDDVVTVHERLDEESKGYPSPASASPTDHRCRGNQPDTVVIIGAGAAGTSGAETLRREGFSGRIVMIDEDLDASVDRPNLSKDFLAGNGPEEWLPLRPDSFYAERGIERLMGRTAVLLDPVQRVIELDDHSVHSYDKLLLATGASARRLGSASDDFQDVHYLRTLTDCRRIIAAANLASSAVIIGAGFLGLEAAAALRTRGLAVHVVTPEPLPLEHILGAEIGACLQRVHEEHGVVFHLRRVARSVRDGRVLLDDGTTLASNLVIAGVGAVPRTLLAQAAGIGDEKGVPVNEFLETRVSNIYAAGDIATWPLAVDGTMTRVEHWVVAQRQGEVAARNMLGASEVFVASPFFWTKQYDLSIRYVGHAPAWDATFVKGDLDAQFASVRYMRQGRHLATATVMRDRENLLAEAEFEEIGQACITKRHVGVRTAQRAQRLEVVP